MEQIELFNTEEIKKDYNEELLAVKPNDDPEAYIIFKRLVAYALLHRDEKKYLIIDRTIEQVKEKGLSYVLCKLSDEAVKFYRYANDVSREKYRATAFMRLRPVDEHKVLIGEFELKHQTAELIMFHFMKRFPRYNVILTFGEDVYIGRNKEIYHEKAKRPKTTQVSTPDEFEKYWLAFYRSQFIPERKNLRYLKRMIPKKYWPWVTELKEFGLT